MLVFLLILFTACVGIVTGFVLGLSWWWIKFMVRRWLQGRVLASLTRRAKWINRRVDWVDAALERMYCATREAEEMAGLLETECRVRLPPL